MSKMTSDKKFKSSTYEAPAVSEETLDSGGNYVSPPSMTVDKPYGGGYSSGTLGNSVIE